jgi:hypothetical protein
MGRHEDLKDLCCRILEYYGIACDTEFTLPNNERVDLVGYSQGNHYPDVGIEIELTSKFQKDIERLLNMNNLKLRIIVTTDSDTLKSTRSVSGIDIFLPPDVDTGFQDRIREYTGADAAKKPWFDTSKKLLYTLEEAVDMLPNLQAEIREQGLSQEVAEDVIFRCALGGYYVGYYSQGKQGTMFNRKVDVQKELLYLRARGLVFEDRPGKSYELGRASIYHLAGEYDKLATEIISKRIKKNRESIASLEGKYGRTLLLISLIGYEGEFIDHSANPDYKSLGSLWGVYLPGPLSATQGIVERFNISPETLYAIKISASSPLLRREVTSIYKAFSEAGLGNKVEQFGSVDIWYYVPLYNILEELKENDWPSPTLETDLKDFASWNIIRSNPHSTDIFYNSFEAIGINLPDVESRVDELAKEGITSKLVKQGTEAVAIYDEKRFDEYCSKRMIGILERVLHRD